MPLLPATPRRSPPRSRAQPSIIRSRLCSERSRSAKTHRTTSWTRSSGSLWNALRHTSRSTESKSAARSATLQRSFSIVFVTVLPPSVTRFHGLYRHYGQLTRLYFKTDYNKQRDAPRSQNIDEVTAATRKGVRLLR